VLIDLYELTMAQSELEHGLEGPATFSVFARHLPPGWGFFLSVGLDDVLSYLEHFEVTEPDLAYLASTGRFSTRLLDRLRGFRFGGSVRALPEGTVFFPQEPILEVTAPLIEAQLVETAVLNMAHFQSLVATKAARCLLAARGKRLVDFGARRTHGSDAALKAPAARISAASTPAATSPRSSAMASQSRAPWPTRTSRRSETSWQRFARTRRAFPTAVCCSWTRMTRSKGLGGRRLSAASSPPLATGCRESVWIRAT
jgi:putative nicotinate phosphoribosyltransferase